MASPSQPIIDVEQATIPKILIADDQPDVLEALRLLLKGHGYETESVSSPSAILSALDAREFDLLLMDLNYARDTTSGREGLDLLEHIQSREAFPPIVVMTGWATVGLAVQAMQRGVGDFVEKPWVNSRLVEILEKQIGLGRERREMRRHAREDELERIEISEKVRRQEQDMAEALSIQMRLLPAELPQAPGYAIAADWRPARIVGGDYYDVLRFDENTLGFCIADVAGKGMPAALLMSNLQAAVRGLASSSVSPEELCTAINRLLCRSIAGDRFITFFYAVLDIPSGLLRYTNAGHPAPLVVRSDGSHAALFDGGGVLGVFEGGEFCSGEIQLSVADRVVLFTDGLLEAHDDDGEEFGSKRILEECLSLRHSDAASVLDGIFARVREFGGRVFEDDATLLVLAVGNAANSL
jgi:sigma-B regulation protein RsbU (phosphoserine phosphatase)